MAMKLTPMLQQYKKIKRNIPEGVILMFRLGDFYEMFFEDAKVASRVLNIALTARSKEEGKNYPMCGIPYHAADSYIGKFIKAGFKVAVCDQVEDPKFAKGIVERRVTRFVTPGTTLDSQLLEDKRNNFLASFNKLGAVYGLSFLDLSTGEFKVTEQASEEDFFGEFSRVSPTECIMPLSFKENKTFLDKLNVNGNILIDFYEDWIFDYENCYSILRDHFKTQSLDGFGCQGFVPGITAAGAIIHYLKENLYKTLGHIQRIVPYSTNDYMILDAATISNLDLVEKSNRNDKDASLIGVLDYTSTSMGARLLRNWVKQPLINIDSIKKRQDAIKLLYEQRNVLENLKEVLREVPDIFRLIGRIDCGVGNARDLVAVKNALIQVSRLKEILKSIDNHYIQQLRDKLIELPELVCVLEKGVAETPPLSVREGGIIKDGFNSELNELRNISTQAKGWLTNLQVRETERTGIRSLKVRYNKVFGYYIEVTKTNLGAVPEDYIRKQTLVNAERFIIPELKEYETKILNARETSCDLEYRIFTELREQVAHKTKEIQQIASSIATLDVLSALSEVALRNNYIFPEINAGSAINITGGRHPVLERYLSEGRRFVPNDTLMDSYDNQLLIITGPNMAGKSTYIRQVALLTLIAQIGSAIPAEKAVIGVVDRIFTRVGARDEITKGQSTFMVEMNETAYILNNATQKSLIVLDEIGRGTSTFDGISIAWAVAEYLLRGQKRDNGEGEFLGPKTLFATHYHELTELADLIKGVKNYNVSVREWNDEIIFLYKIVAGGADKSYGIHVARLAGLPYGLLERAKEILARLEEGSFSWKKMAPKTGAEQLYLFDNPDNTVIEGLKNLKLDYLTPIEALNKLREIKEKLR